MYKRQEKDLDGIIAIGKFSDKEINLMNEYSSNIVFLDSSPDDEKYDSVKINFKMGVFSALDYLYNLGHTRIGYIGDGNTSVSYTHLFVVFRGRKMGETFAISKLYEESLDINIKKSKGVYYTPKIIVDYILNKTIKNHDILKLSLIHIW